ncbi:histone deacetylase family protein [Sulfurivirga sp.]|uniref:histone deacetylase family protein n=1 Tax=Sulfurivirga sp. TaxID=2614236 RepID=UPI0025F6A1A4|nr:histone deacetylase family protein [Sulfurivirga sp.]
MPALHVWSYPLSEVHRNCTPGHPESPARWTRLEKKLRAADLVTVWHRSAPAAVAVVERAHAPGYVAALRRHLPPSGCRPLDEDTGLSPQSLDAALHACGGVVEAVEQAASGRLQRAFCLHRPPGHHAEPARPMGFCLINHVAVAALHAVEALGVERVAIVDFDVHHGNGTEVMVAGHAGIRFWSSFQHPFYPYSGVPPLAENCVGLPLAAGSDGEAFRSVWAPVLADMMRWSPQLILVSAGFDAHVRDPLGSLALTQEDFAWMGMQLAEVADRAGAPLVSALEGGYDLDALCESVEAYLRAQL